MPGIDGLRILQFVVVHYLRLRLAGHALLALERSRAVVFGVPAVVAATADFAFGEGIDNRALRSR